MIKKKTTRAVLGILLSALALPANAQTQVSAYNTGIVAEGVSYFLPQTEIMVKVVSTATTYTPGEFCRYAERYLHITGVRQNSETKHVISEMSVQPIGTPDTTKHYTIKLKDKTIAPFVRLDDKGVLLAINTDNETWQDAIKVPAEKRNNIKPKDFLTHEILSANSIAKMAELTAAEIYDIRESRSAIMKGEVETMPKDGASLKIVLDELNRQEEALLQLFIGYEESKSTVKTFTYTPKGDTDKDIIFRHSEKYGFTTADDLGGNPYYISVKDQHSVSLPTAEESAKRKITGVVYNLPSLANIRIFTPLRTYFDTELPIAQFGTVDVLSSTLFNKGATTKVTFNASTGAITKIEK